MSSVAVLSIISLMAMSAISFLTMFFAVLRWTKLKKDSLVLRATCLTVALVSIWLVLIFGLRVDLLTNVVSASVILVTLVIIVGIPFWRILRNKYTVKKACKLYNKQNTFEGR